MFYYATNPWWRDHHLGAWIIPRLTTNNWSVYNRCVIAPVNNPVHISHNTTPKSTTDSAKWWFPQEYPLPLLHVQIPAFIHFLGDYSKQLWSHIPTFSDESTKNKPEKTVYSNTNSCCSNKTVSILLIKLIHLSSSLTHQLNHIWSTLGSPGIVPMRPRCDEPNPGVSQGLPLRKDLHHHSSAVETPRCCEVADFSWKSLFHAKNKKVRGQVGLVSWLKTT